jgi:hypothetical protein
MTIELGPHGLSADPEGVDVLQRATIVLAVDAAERYAAAVSDENSDDAIVALADLRAATRFIPEQLGGLNEVASMRQAALTFGRAPISADLANRLCGRLAAGAELADLAQHLTPNNGATT